MVALLDSFATCPEAPAPWLAHSAEYPFAPGSSHRAQAKARGKKPKASDFLTGVAATAKLKNLSWEVSRVRLIHCNGPALFCQLRH